MGQLPGAPGPARRQDGDVPSDIPVVTLSDGLVSLRPWSRDDARFMAEASADPGIFLTIVAGNEDSVAVARRAGFVYEGTMRAHGVWQGQRCDVMLFAALALEWAMRRLDEET
jgi:hypothetical protein